MSLAWAMYKQTKTFTSFGDALRQAWLSVKAAAALKGEQTLVTFRKSDGSITERLATAFTGPVKGTGKSSPLTVVFHSITDGGTRSFRADRLVSYQKA